MPLSASDKAALVATAATLTTEVNALVVDPAVNPLQAQLDAANAALATANVSITAQQATIAAMQAKIDAAKAALG